MRAKLFRFDCSSQSPEWKERGVGDVKFMEHKSKDRSVRLVMRRDKTHKICANHFITPDMKLTPSSGSDRAWVWTVQADFADEEAKVEQLAIRFKNRENALQFKEQFERCQERAVNSETDDLTSDLKTLNLEEEEEEEKGEETPTPAQTEEEKTGTTTSEDPVPQ
ncbi:Ran-specific GTPase-activating protein [Geodia barretti]|nr:Ran-specific GTPase-activating protein [Geodia barretti]